MGNPQDFEWRNYILPDGGPVLAKRCQARAKFVDSIVVAVHQDIELVGIYLNQEESVESALCCPATRVIQDNELKIPELHKLLYRDDVERIFGELEAAPFYEAYPATLYVYDIIRKWNEVRLPGWVYTTMNSRGFALLKDFGTFEDGYHTIGVTDAGIAVYRSSIKSGGSFCSDDQLFYMSTECISIEALARISSWPDSMECCALNMSLRRWIYYAALNSE